MVPGLCDSKQIGQRNPDAASGISGIRLDRSPEEVEAIETFETDGAIGAKWRALNLPSPGSLNDSAGGGSSCNCEVGLDALLLLAVSN